MSHTPLRHPVILRRAFRLLRGLATLGAFLAFPVMFGWAMADAFTRADTLVTTLRHGFDMLSHVLSLCPLRNWHAGYACN